MKRAAIVHDWANLICLPMLCTLAVAGLCGGVEPTTFARCIFLYVALDTVWVMIQPEAVPAAITAIRIHHVVTLLLCIFPLVGSVFRCSDAHIPQANNRSLSLLRFVCLTGEEGDRHLRVPRRSHRGQHILPHCTAAIQGAGASRLLCADYPETVHNHSSCSNLQQSLSCTAGAADSSILGNFRAYPTYALPVPTGGVCHTSADQHSGVGTPRHLVLSGELLDDLLVDMA